MKVQLVSATAVDKTEGNGEDNSNVAPAEGNNSNNQEPGNTNNSQNTGGQTQNPGTNTDPDPGIDPESGL